MNTSDSAQNTCPKCGRPILEGAPRGLCPLCLISEVAKDDSPLPMMPDPELDDLRRAFPTLEIVEVLGAGGMGRVYKVRQPHLDRFGALKLLPPGLAEDPAWVERFTREARALARLNHPGIVQVYDFGEASSQVGEGSPKKFPFLLMEYVDGVNLRQALRAGSLTAAEALTIVPPICAALQYAHEQGVLHRDIKPENILLDTDGRVKIADFGVAKLAGNPGAPGATLTATGAQLGTAAYMAPEQIERPQDVDHRADIYSLGVVFYELLTGELPLGRFPAPSEKAGTDPRLDTIVFRTLEKERERRFQSAGEVKTEVEHVTSSEPPTMRAAVRQQSASPVASRKVVALVLSLVMLPIVLIAIGLLLPWAWAHGGASWAKVGLGVAGFVLLLGATLVVVGFTWLFRRLQRGGLSTGVAAMIVTIGLLVLPPAGCIVLLMPAYVFQKRSSITPAGTAQLHRIHSQFTGSDLLTRWTLTSRTPLWVTVQHGESEVSIAPGPAANGTYTIGITAEIARRVEGGSARLNLTVTNNRNESSAGKDFQEPLGDWFNGVFSNSVQDGLLSPGQYPLMRIGETPVTLIFSSKPPAEPGKVMFTVQNVYMMPEGDTVYLGVDYGETVQGNAELYFDTFGLPEPSVTKNNTIISDRPVPSVRRVWRIPSSVDEAARKELEDQIERQYLRKTISVPRGQLWQFFQVPLPDGKIARVTMGARERSLEPR
jgi:serine/threonine protein kinase